nr:MAG TPA: major vault protein-like protein [Caudoviricetes sp.]
MWVTGLSGGGVKKTKRIKSLCRFTWRLHGRG